MSTKSEKRITILNLYNSGINPEIIALELDTSKDKVMRVIHEEEDRNSEVKIGASLKSKSKTENLLINKLYLDAVIDIESVLIDSQTRMWKALKVKPEFKISLSETQRVLEKFVESKVELAVLHIDLVGSTKLSMTLSIDKLSAIIRAFAQEISLVVSMYGGYVLKYIGDAVLAFFVVERVGESSNDDKDTLSPYSLQSRNVVSCACTMVRVIQQGLNPILNQYDYPELHVRIGIDFGEIGVVQYGVDIDELDGKAVFTRPHIDMIGSTISIAVKMTSIAEPDHIIIGEKLYNKLKKKQKEIFKEIMDPSSVGNYIDEINEGKYHIYESL
jgi:class 3 adenylate cyclase